MTVPSFRQCLLNYSVGKIVKGVRVTKLFTKLAVRIIKEIDS